MRIVGFVTVNGTRVPLDWSITGTQIESGVGLSSRGVEVFVNLPSYVDEDGGKLEQAVEMLVTETFYDSMTVSDLRVELSSRELPLYGNKADLVSRLLKDDAGVPAEEEVAEETADQVVEETTETEVEKYDQK